MNPLDELFRSKLSQHATEPSAASWSAIEKQLDAKRKPVALWRWAAVLLLGGLLFVIFTTLRHQPEPVLTETKPVTTSPQEVVKQENEKQKSLRPTTIHQVVTRSPRTKNVNPVVPPTFIAEKVIALEEKPKDEVVVTEAAATPEPVVATGKPATGIVLTFTLEPIPTIAPVTAVAEEVTPEEKPATTLLAKARRGELPIGDFRQLKDNLFALDIHRKTTTKQQ